MSLRGKLFAVTYDRNMARVEKAGLRALRQSLLAAAEGNVLEIGGGTGANLTFYRPEVESLTITEEQLAEGFAVIDGALDIADQGVRA
jgi:cyclopropane fatty-acyl-phospholipid synthase-like methyltransferase